MKSVSNVAGRIAEWPQHFHSISAMNILLSIDNNLYFDKNQSIEAVT